MNGTKHISQKFSKLLQLQITNLEVTLYDFFQNKKKKK